MPIRPPALRTKLLRAGGDSSAGRAVQALLAQEEPTGWLLLVDLAPGSFGVFGVLDLTDSVRQRLEDSPDTPLRELAPACPVADAEEDTVEALRQRGSPTGYVVALRDGDVAGVVMLKRGGSVLSINDVATIQPAATGTEPRPLPPRADRYVNTDLADAATPAQALSRTQALAPGGSYLVRVRVGELEASSLEASPTALPSELLTKDITLDVVLFSEDFAIEGAATGAIFVPVSGPTRVTRQAAPAGLAADAALLGERLLFAVRAPERSGLATLRCSLYLRGVLVQSRLVSAVVGEGQPLDASGSLRSAVLDFNLSPSLAPQVLDQLEPHRLSLMLNSDGGGSHAFRLVSGDGQELYANSATLSSSEVQNLIEKTRERLREVAWGKPTDFDGEDYRYDAKVAADERAKRFRADLIRLARRGAVMYSAAINKLAGGADGLAQLRALMKTPGMVQLATRNSFGDIVPIAMFYDAPIDEQEPGLTICPAFEQSLASGRPLDGEPCFQGSCPSHGDLTVVCPSGFWGFRHDIGMPFPVSPRGPELATSIPYSGTPAADVAFFSDFPTVGAHLKQLAGLPWSVAQASPRKDVISLLKQSHPQVVYFYCHGAEVDTIPFLRVGGDAGQDYISTTNLLNYQIGWPAERPLVFINGCHTTALTPEKAISFVAAFVENTAASGVIGTEITIFEPLAQTFAETFLAKFLAGEPLGRAVRLGRLALLAQQNPLGLVYLPNGYAGLRLVKS